MDFTKNREFFSRSRCVNFKFLAHSLHVRIFHSWRETNHVRQISEDFHAMIINRCKLSHREIKSEHIFMP